MYVLKIATNRALQRCHITFIHFLLNFFSFPLLTFSDHELTSKVRQTTREVYSIRR